jgi:hypothetical protein
MLLFIYIAKTLTKHKRTGMPKTRATQHYAAGRTGENGNSSSSPFTPALALPQAAPNPRLALGEKKRGKESAMKYYIDSVACRCYNL